MKKVLTIIIVLFQLLFVGSAFGSDLSTSISNTLNSVAISVSTMGTMGTQEQECAGVGEEKEGAAPGNTFHKKDCNINIEIYTDNAEDLEFVG